MKAALKYHLHSVLNSYAILFFSQNKILGLLLLAVSFFNVQAGLAGLFCVLLSLIIVTLAGFEKHYVHIGIYNFNALIVGLAFGTFYQFNYALVLWLVTASLVAIVLSVTLSAWLAKYHLPVLSVPFIITCWVVMLAASQYNGIGLLPQNGLLVNQLSLFGGNHLTNQLCKLGLPYYPDLFFRALSAIIFQNSAITGIVMGIAVLIHSRITFSLMVIGFITACWFHRVTGFYSDSVSYYNLGANFMMGSAAIGGFFLVPSFRSYLLAVVSIPVMFLLINAFSKMIGIYYLPVFSMPFCVIALWMLYFFTLRAVQGKLQLTPVQHYSPEKNLYQYLNNVKRLDDLKYLRLNLPFMGAWTVSQGYAGAITHKGEWADALDFVIEDEEHKTYDYSGTRPEHFYCFNKPVLACADGIVANVTDNVEDNEIGKVNTTQNWGNTVVIKHAEDLYSKVSHLKKNSVKVKPGDYVKQGDLLGLCGNSGLSPEPHLHFQVQATPYIGSKTLSYPFAGYIASDGNGQISHQTFSIPAEGTIVNAATVNTALKQAFAFEPGYHARVKTENGQAETWEVFKDACGTLYLHSKETAATAYFINTGCSFYFTNFYGDRSSLLYSFYVAAYKINFNTAFAGVAYDTFALHPGDVGLWLHDIIAPFYRFMKLTYKNTCKVSRDEIMINSERHRHVFNREKLTATGEIRITDNKLSAFTVKLNHKTTEAVWAA